MAAMAARQEPARGVVAAARMVRAREVLEEQAAMGC
jgi:hypothetical protein